LSFDFSIAEIILIGILVVEICCCFCPWR